MPPARRSRRSPPTTRSSASRSSARTSRRRCSRRRTTCTDIKVPGMVHGRMIRPAVAGAVPVKVDESSIKDIPGAQVVHQNGFLGVVADKEWDAIQAARSSRSSGRRSSRRSRTRTRSTTTSARRRCASARSRGKTAGNVDEAFKTAAKVIEAEYEWPFQSHAADGTGLRAGRDQGRQGQLLERHAEVALRADRPRRQLGVPLDNVHVHWMHRPGLLRPQRRRRLRGGRRGAGQGGRQAGARCNTCATQGTGWDPKGPASIHRRAPRSTPRATSSPMSS